MDVPLIKPETYMYRVRCSNCYYSRTVAIPKGMLVEAFIAEEPKCPNCGCPIRKRLGK